MFNEILLHFLKPLHTFKIKTSGLILKFLKHRYYQASIVIKSRITKDESESNFELLQDEVALGTKSIDFFAVIVAVSYLSI